MTHLWHGVPPSALCDTHLEREWSELHDLLAIWRGEWEVPTWEGDGSTALANIVGHVEDGQVCLAYVAERARRLAQELLRRGSDVTVPDVSIPYRHYCLGPADVREYNVRTLVAKCDDCAAGLRECGLA